MTATSSESSINSMVDYEFTVAFKDGCLLDTLTQTSVVDNLAYYIAITGPQVITAPSYSQKVLNCEIIWSLVATDIDIDIELTET